MGKKDKTGTDIAAGNGLLDRRTLLKNGLRFGVIAVPAVAAAADRTREKFDPARPPWMLTPGAGFTPYGSPSPFENDVVRFPAPNRVMRNSGVSFTPLHLMEGTITPNGLHYERHHNGVPQIVPEEHRLLVHGLVKKPLFFTVDDLLRYPLRSRQCFIECSGNSATGWNRIPSRFPAGYVHGLVSNTEWTGIPLAVLLDEAGVDKKAAWVVAEGADAFALDVSIPLEKAMDDAVLALYQNGERLRPENGYPLRLVLPGWEGVTNVKWLRRLELREGPIMSRDETARYTDLLPSGKARQFSFIMEAKSLITSPSTGMVLKSGPGLYQITGLAWSGRGRIREVQVTTDGGKSWAAAALQEPVLSKALTRFRIPWRWNGSPALLQSRAVDETGYVQPSRSELIAKRGRNGFYHYNAVVTWKVDSDGTVSHVYENRHEPSGDHVDIDTGWD
jgi:sulfane dehydrogenase subunit SoxC